MAGEGAVVVGSAAGSAGSAAVPVEKPSKAEKDELAGKAVTITLPADTHAHYSGQAKDDFRTLSNHISALLIKLHLKSAKTSETD